MSLDRTMDTLAALIYLVAAVWFATVTLGDWPTPTRIVFAVGAVGLISAFGHSFRAAAFGGKA